MQIMTECSELIRCISPPWLCREITRRTPMCIGIPKARDMWLMFMKTTWFYADVILLKISSCLWRYIVLIQHLLRSRRDRISTARAFCSETLRGILFKKTSLVPRTKEVFLKRLREHLKKHTDKAEKQILIQNIH